MYDKDINIHGDPWLSCNKGICNTGQFSFHHTGGSNQATVKHYQVVQEHERTKTNRQKHNHISSTGTHAHAQELNQMKFHFSDYNTDLER